jgi:hypothetical protein
VQNIQKELRLKKDFAEPIHQGFAEVKAMWHFLWEVARFGT